MKFPVECTSLSALLIADLNPHRPSLTQIKVARDGRDGHLELYVVELSSARVVLATGQRDIGVGRLIVTVPARWGINKPSASCSSSVEAPSPLSHALKH